MPPDPLETLRQVNENLRSALTGLRPERRHCSSIRPQDFFGILQQILRVAECLRNPHSSRATAAFENELLDYRGNLEAFRRFLPDLQIRMLAERSRLESARSHVAAVAAWARVNKKTL